MDLEGNTKISEVRKIMNEKKKRILEGEKRDIKESDLKDIENKIKINNQKIEILQKRSQSSPNISIFQLRLKHELLKKEQLQQQLIRTQSNSQQDSKVETMGFEEFDDNYQIKSEINERVRKEREAITLQFEKLSKNVKQINNDNNTLGLETMGFEEFDDKPIQNNTPLHDKYDNEKLFRPPPQKQKEVVINSDYNIEKPLLNQPYQSYNSIHIPNSNLPKKERSCKCLIQ